MRLKSADLLRALVGPTPEKKMSARRLASYVGCHPSFIDHLLSGRKRACGTDKAQRIAEVLGVPLEVLFVPKTPTSESTSTKRRKVRAAA